MKTIYIYIYIYIILVNNPNTMNASINGNIN